MLMNAVIILMMVTALVDVVMQTLLIVLVWSSTHIVYKIKTLYILMHMHVVTCTSIDMYVHMITNGEYG